MHALVYAGHDIIAEILEHGLQRVIWQFFEGHFGLFGPI
jgi:hypothetical protein